MLGSNCPHRPDAPLFEESKALQDIKQLRLAQPLGMRGHVWRLPFPAAITAHSMDSNAGKMHRTASNIRVQVAEHMSKTLNQSLLLACECAVVLQLVQTAAYTLLGMRMRWAAHHRAFVTESSIPQG